MKDTKPGNTNTHAGVSDNACLEGSTKKALPSQCISSISHRGVDFAGSFTGSSQPILRNSIILCKLPFLSGRRLSHSHLGFIRQCIEWWAWLDANSIIVVLGVSPVKTNTMKHWNPFVAANLGCWANMETFFSKLYSFNGKSTKNVSTKILKTYP